MAVIKFKANLKLIGFMCLTFLCAANGYPLRAGSLPFEDCGSIYDVHLVKISSCTTAPCFVPINQVVTITADFSSDAELSFHDPNEYTTRTVLNHSAFWLLNYTQTRASVTPDACDGRSCPTRTNNGYTFTANIIVDGTLPTLRGNLNWSVSNQFGKTVMCFKVPISLGYAQ